MNTVQTNTVPRTIQDHKLCKEIWIQAPRRTMINTDGEEETGKSQMGKGPWVNDICYNCIDLWLNFELRPLSRGAVQSVSSFLRHLRCTVGRTRHFT